MDRAICYDEWRRLLPDATVRHPIHAHSDHCPLLVALHGVELAKLGEKPFKFQAAWLLHADFENMLKRKWQWSGDFMCSLKCLAEKLHAWNRDTFGNVFWRKSRLRRRLEGIAKELDVRPSVGLLKLKMNLKREWADVLLQEEVLWMQKSRIDWLCFGKNSKFFHTSTLVRRRRNRVVTLQNEDRVWVEDAADLKGMALALYKELFTSERLAGGEFTTGCFPRMDASTTKELSKEVSMEETQRALRDMGSYKVPWPDGYQAIFFKKTREITGAAIHSFVKMAIDKGELPEEDVEAALVLILRRLTLPIYVGLDC